MGNQQAGDVDGEALFTAIEYAVLRKMQGNDSGELAACKDKLLRHLSERSILLKACLTVQSVIHRVENRCMAADGPVTRTSDEISDPELVEMYGACELAIVAAGGRHA